MARAALCSTLTLLLAATGCDSAPTDHGASVVRCATDADCAGGTCRDGSCLASCEVDGDCADGEICTASGACAPAPADECATAADCLTPAVCRIKAGATCAAGRCVYLAAADGAACTLPTGAAACFDGACRECSYGDCCTNDADCAAFSTASACTVVADCQGQRQEGYCGPAHLCLTRSQDDDSGCAGRIAAACGRFRDLVCGDAVVQSPRACATSCESTTTPGTTDDTACDSGLACAVDQGSFRCTPTLVAGECCKETSCPDDLCTSGLHCGDQQAAPVFVCCAAGSTCCTAHEECSGDPALVAPCDLATATCITSCGENDTLCISGYHCDAGRCAADQVIGQPCDEPSDCTSGHCTEELSTGSGICAPIGTCADEATFYDVGSARCFGDTELARCEAGGSWAPFREPSPDLTDDLCLNGAGFDAAARCTTAGFVDPACVACTPYVAADGHSCYTTCVDAGVDLDARCAPDFHCASGVCVARVADGTPCAQDNHCTSNNCATDLFGDQPDRCAPANHCVNDGVFFTVGQGYCVGATTFWECVREGAWAAAGEPSPDLATTLCSPTSGANTGVDPAATCNATGFTDPPCASCSPYRPTTATPPACRTNCATNNSAYCLPGYHCAGDNLCYSNANGNPCNDDVDCTSYVCLTTPTPRVCSARLANGLSCTRDTECASSICLSGAGTCSAALANGQTCTRDVECSSLRCDGTCQAKLANTNACDEDSDCTSGRCDGNCMDQLPDGSVCDEDSDCFPTSYCAGGFCQVYSSTCPILYTGTGGSFAMESDVFPSGKLGLRQTVGFRKPYPYDHYLLRHDPVVTDGELELRLVEERYEVNYLDEVRLFAIDVPADRDVVAEVFSVLPTGYVPPEAMLHTVAQQLQPLASAVLVDTGADLASQLAASDGDFLMLSEDNNLGIDWRTVEIDLGDVSAAPMVKLVIDAKTVFPSTPEGYARSRALDPSNLRTRLLTEQADGSWTEVPQAVAVLTRPKEFTRLSVIDVTYAIAVPTRAKLRLQYVLKTYIDSIRFDTTADETVSVRAVPLVAAALGNYGFSARTSDGDNYDFVYGDRVERTLVKFPGYYTRPGDVTELLADVDDLFVVFGTTDEVRLRFHDTLPSPAGTTRRWVFSSNGYYKSWKTIDIERTVAPLPFAAMSNFPYDEGVEGYPQDELHQDYLRTWNTRAYPPE